jgi:2-polyprenyl-6-methoxyphenol hydroxylase-like FAD-dependent oxidoreductase
MCGRPGRLMGVWPTNDDLVMTYVAAPMADLDSVRADLEGMTGDLGERIRAGRRAHRVVVTPDVPNRVRRPYGPGWALVGDAGLVMDPILGQGIGDAFRDAELLTDAVASGLDGPGLDAGLAAYQARRDAAALPMYEFSISLASFAPPPPEHQMLFQALAGNQAEIDRFLAVLTGVVPLPDYFAADNLMRLLGNTGMVEPGRQPERRAS